MNKKTVKEIKKFILGVFVAVSAALLVWIVSNFYKSEATKPNLVSTKNIIMSRNDHFTDDDITDITISDNVGNVVIDNSLKEETNLKNNFQKSIQNNIDNSRKTIIQNRNEQPKQMVSRFHLRKLKRSFIYV